MLFANLIQNTRKDLKKKKRINGYNDERKI